MKAEIFTAQELEPSMCHGHFTEEQTGVLRGQVTRFKYRPRLGPLFSLLPTAATLGSLWLSGYTPGMSLVIKIFNQRIVQLNNESVHDQSIVLSNGLFPKRV